MDTSPKIERLSPTVGKGEVTYRYLLTDKALRIAEGGHVTGITEADWNSYLEWMERREKVELIVNQFAEQFTKWKNQ